jgi:hypothetical protein
MPLLRPRVIGIDKPGPGRIMVGAASKDNLLKAIVTWIPVEVLTVYKTVDGFIPPDRNTFRLWFAVASTLICVLWIAFATKPNEKPIAWRQVILAPFAFACWVAAMQGDMLKGFDSRWESWIGAVILGLGTLLLPILDGILKAAGLRQNP